MAAETKGRSRTKDPTKPKDGAKTRDHEVSIRAMAEGFKRNDLLTYASAIAFQVASALPPIVLFALGSTQYFWLTAGLALTVWELSGAMRAVMGALEGVYGTKEQRSLGRRLGTSTSLAVATLMLGLLALGVIHLGGELVPVEGAFGALWALVRWLLAGLLLLFAVALIVRKAPPSPQPVAWVSIGSAIVVTGWVVMSVAFGWYVTTVASYGSIFGNLASIFVLITYLYLSSIVFMGGSPARRPHTRTRRGLGRREPRRRRLRFDPRHEGSYTV